MADFCKRDHPKIGHLFLRSLARQHGLLMRGDNWVADQPRITICMQAEWLEERSSTSRVLIIGGEARMFWNIASFALVLILVAPISNARVMTEWLG